MALQNFTYFLGWKSTSYNNNTTAAPHGRKIALTSRAGWNIHHGSSWKVDVHLLEQKPQSPISNPYYRYYTRYNILNHTSNMQIHTYIYLYIYSIYAACGRPLIYMIIYNVFLSIVYNGTTWHKHLFSHGSYPPYLSPLGGALPVS